jgi:predicted transposase/invertase (TIGR01784 family)
MAKFINPFTDIGFKRIFGQEFSKPLLLHFLNNLLVGEKEIVDLTFLDKEQPAMYADDRSLIYDIYCKTTDGEHIIVEMQNNQQPYFKKRSIYYVSEAISRQGERGTDWRYDIKSVYLVAFLNFRIDDIGTKFRTDAVLMDKESKEIFSNDIRMIYLQLPYFEKQADECENDFERWIYVLKNMEALNRMPFAAKDSVFAKIAQIADISALSKEERMKYDEGIRKYRDTICVMDYAIESGLKKGFDKGMKQGIEQGMKQGIEQGRAEGEKQGRYEVAQKLLAMGLPIESVLQATGLSKDDVKQLMSR